MVNNIPVNGWPQLKDLEAVQPTLDRLDKIEDWKRTVKEETFTGDDITIENALALPARSLVTTINAIQDLHGLPFPYVGGAYKNKLPMTVSGIKAANTGGTWSGNAYTYRGVTWTIQTDNADNVTGIKANGTATGLCSFKIAEFTGLSDIALNGCPSGGSGTNYNQQLYDETSAVWGSSDYGSGVTVNNLDTTHTYSVWAVVRSDITVSNLLFLPMIRLSTESDASFAPYSNKCPISGRDRVVLTRSDGDEISEDFTIQLGTTVYGADINWDTGVGIADKVLTVVNNNSAISATGSGGFPFYVNCLTGAKASTASALSGVLSNYLTEVTQSSSWGTPFTFSRFTSNNDRVFFKLSNDITTVDAAKTYLASNPIQFCYELATPTTIQLTPEQLEMLKGYNRITLSDGYGTIELKALTGANWS